MPLQFLSQPPAGLEPQLLPLFFGCALLLANGFFVLLTSTLVALNGGLDGTVGGGAGAAVVVSFVERLPVE